MCSASLPKKKTKRINFHEEFAREKKKGLRKRSVKLMLFKTNTLLLEGGRQPVVRFMVGFFFNSDQLVDCFSLQIHKKHPPESQAPLQNLI